LNLLFNSTKVQANSFDYAIKLNDTNFKLLINLSINDDDIIPLHFIKESSILNLLHSHNFQTYKFDYFNEANFTYIKSIKVHNSYSSQSIHIQEMLATDKLKTQIKFDKTLKCFESQASTLTESPIVLQCQVTNNINIYYFIFYIVKNLITRELDTSTVDYLECIIHSAVKSQEEKEFILIKCKEVIRKLFRYKSNLNETRLEQDSCALLLRVRKYFKNNDLINIFVELRKIYTSKDYSSVVMFIIHLIVYYYGDNKVTDLKTFCKSTVSDLVKELTNDVNISVLLNRYFVKPFKFKKRDKTKNESLYLYIIFTLNAFLGNRTELYELFIRESSKLKCIYVIINLLKSLQTKIKSTEIINYSLNLSNKFTSLANLKKILMSFAVIVVEETNVNSKLENILILLNVNTEIKGYKKTIIDKSINTLLNLFSQEVHKTLFSLKLSQNFCSDTVPNEFKENLFANENLFMNKLIHNICQSGYNYNDTLDVNTHILTKLKVLVNNSIILINFILRKNKHKKKLRLLFNTNSSTTDKFTLKYLPLVKKIKFILFYIYLSLNLIRLNYIIISKSNNKEKLTICLNIYMFISFYSSIKYPDNNALFSNEIFEIFTSKIANTCDQDFIEHFFTLMDTDLSEDDDPTAVIRNLKIKLKNEFPIYNEKLSKITKAKKNVENIPSMIQYLLNHYEPYKQYYNSLLDDLFDSKLLPGNLLTSIKLQRKSVKKDADKIFYQLDNLISFADLFSNDKETSIYKPPIVEIPQTTKLQESTARILKESLQRTETMKGEFVYNYNDEGEKEASTVKYKANLKRKAKKYVKENKSDIDNDDDKLTIRYQTDMKINRKQKEEIFTNSDYTVENISDISNLSGLGNVRLREANLNNADESEYIMQDFSSPGFKLTEPSGLKNNSQNVFRDAISFEASDIYDNNDAGHSLLEHTLTSNRYKASAFDVTNYHFFTNENNLKSKKPDYDMNIKKKYIGFKMFIVFINKKIGTCKKAFIKTLKFINPNISKVEAITQTIETKPPESNNKSKLKILGKSLYPILTKKNKTYIKK
jgi:hypothetical protein